MKGKYIDLEINKLNIYEILGISEYPISCDTCKNNMYCTRCIECPCNCVCTKHKNIMKWCPNCDTWECVLYNCEAIRSC